MELAFFKPVLSSLLLPPAGPLLLVFAGAAVGLRWRRAGSCLVAVASLLLWLLCCNSMAVWLAAHALPQYAALSPAQTQALRQQGVQAIVVLGGGVNEQAPEYGHAEPSRTTAARLRYGVMLARHSGLPLAFSGGIGWSQAMGTATTAAEAAVTEADTAQRMLEQDYGLRLQWAEPRSRDTAQNAQYSYALLAPQGVQRIALVTNAWHMPRAAREFAQAGFALTPAPMGYVTPQDHSLLEWLPSAYGLVGSRQVLREWLALRALH